MKFTKKYPGETIRALSWKQPFASLMLHGKIETRVWDSKYRGWVLICASQSSYNLNQFQFIGCDYTGLALKTLVDAHNPNLLKLPMTEMYKELNNLIPHGKAIAIGRLKNSRALQLSDQSKAFVGFQYGLYAHEYEEVQAIEPFEWKGKQGWSTLNDEQMDKIVLL